MLQYPISFNDGDRTFPEEDFSAVGQEIKSAYTPMGCQTVFASKNAVIRSGVATEVKEEIRFKLWAPATRSAG